MPAMVLPLGLARLAVERYVRTREVIASPRELPSEIAVPGAAFVTLRIGRELRGCIGNLAPIRATLAEEIISNAISAATSDPRFPPVRADELPALNYEVDILSPLEPVGDEAGLDPERYGVVVEAGGRRGVLLPAIEGITTVAQQVSIAREKAGIAPNEPIHLSRFTVTRFREDPID
jgi:AmmeMemoRadiSam system protein A